MADKGYPARVAPSRPRTRRRPADEAPLQAEDAERTIVVRDRRKPNQYTTDNVIAREWLPILRVGDAFFFYSVYLSMANRETESSWSSLRTQAEYLQCSVDLIVRGNRLLEICELVHIETGNQYTSNEYYILDPPPLSDELKARIRERLDDIARQETSRNWQSWVDQVRKALDRHQTLPDIWAERRARRGGRPVKTRRPKEAPALENGVCETQAPFRGDSGKNGKGACVSQPGCTCCTSTVLVQHEQGVRDTQPEQSILTKVSEQGKGRKEVSSLFVREWLSRLGVAEGAIVSLQENHSTQEILRQLEWLRYRNPRDPAAMLVSAVQGDWDPPGQMGNADGLAPAALGQVSSIGPLPPDTGDAASRIRDSAREEEQESVGTERNVFVVAGTAVDARDAWTQLLAEIRLQMTRVTFDTWLNGTTVAGVRESVISVLVRDEYAAEWLQTRWEGPISRTLGGIVGCPVAVRFLAPGVEG